MVILLDCVLITTIGLREMFGPAKGHVSYVLGGNRFGIVGVDSCDVYDMYMWTDNIYRVNSSCFGLA